MKNNLVVKAVVKYLAGLLSISMLLFIPAGTLKYYNAWLFIALLFIPIFVLGVVLYIKAPELLEKRLNAKEKETDQKAIIAVSGLTFILTFILAALDFRFKLTFVHPAIVILASAVLLVSYCLYVEVMRENSYLSRTIEVHNGQKVIDTGLYRIVRHPMYMATVFLFLSIPIVLGSWISVAVMLMYPIIIAKRIKGEETLLEQELEGYTEYKRKVKYKIIPFVW